ncbi:MAG: phosphoribosyltransferase family protein [Thermoplasmata archaeon]|nr:phosphoribosyltransferase family protein [Thermoplasmata archaeon]
MKKVFITPNKLYMDSFRLARKIYLSGFRPDFLIGIWRGGTPPGIVVHEYFRVKGIDPYHTAIKTQSYRGLKTTGEVEIKGMEHVLRELSAEQKLLIVDDVWDTGITIKKVLEFIKERKGKNAPEIKVGVVYFKKEKNQVDIVPDYYYKIINEWIVFPHELEGLTREEIRKKSKVMEKIVFG